MLKYPTLTLLIILLSSLGIGSAMANITFSEPQILILGIDDKEQMVARSSKPHKALVRSLRRGLQKAGYRVLEQNRAQIGDYRQNRRQAVRLAKKAGLGSDDILLLIAARPRTKQRRDTVTSAFNVKLQIVDPANWRSIENIHWTTRPIRYDIYDCGHKCAKKKRVRLMKASGHKLQQLLARTLDQTFPAADRREYSNSSTGRQQQTPHAPGIVSLTLQGFSRAEAHYLEQRLAGFSDNADISLRRDDGARRQYWYETDIPAWKLEKKLSRDLARMGLVARLIENEDNGAITVIRQRREVAYYSNE